MGKYIIPNTDKLCLCPICGQPLELADKGTFTNEPFNHDDDCEYIELSCDFCGSSVVINGCKEKDKHQYRYYHR